MRLLMIHAANFSYRAREKSPKICRAQSDSARHQEVSLPESLVVFVAVEKADEADLGYVVNKAVAEIDQLCDDLSATRVVLYPYAHLASDLSSPVAAVQVIEGVANGLRQRDVTLAPFGWYKSFSIECKGHPRSETYREISVRRPQGKLVARGKEHPVCALNQRFREILLDLGLDEMVNPCIVNEAEVYRQYGPEAPIILDRVFYLAGLPRPDIGISQAEVTKIASIVPGFSGKEALEALFRDYKRGSIESDDLTVVMSTRLGFSEKQVIRIVDEVFPQFKTLEPVPVRKTLRSHMTSLWFPVLASLQTRRPLPVQLFSIGPRYRREQRQDTRHLFESTTVSIAIMDRAFSMEDAHELSRRILGRLGFQEFSFRVKPVTSNYYASGTDTEVYAGRKGQDIEVANLGFYAEAALANYGIEHPVFNLGFGSERLAMVLEDVKDIRVLAYPQFYEEAEFTDEDIARSLVPIKAPKSKQGIELVNQLVATALANKSQTGPVEVLVYDGGLLGAHVRVSVYNWDEGKPLFGRAITNRVFVYNSGIYGVPTEQLSQISDMSDQPVILRTLYKVWERGTNTDLWLVELMMKQAVADLESSIERHELAFDMKVRALKKPSHINIHVPHNIEEYIEQRQKPIKVVGPVFAGVKAEITYDAEE